MADKESKPIAESSPWPIATFLMLSYVFVSFSTGWSKKFLTINHEVAVC